MTADPYFQPPHSGPRCSTPRAARLRQRRFEMGREKRTVPDALRNLADKAKSIFVEAEPHDPALARARAMRHIVEHCPLALEPDTVLLGGEDPFLFNLLLPCLKADRYTRHAWPHDALPQGMWWGPCFEGHITPAVERLATEGLNGIRRRIQARQASLADPAGRDAGVTVHTPSPALPARGEGVLPPRAGGVRGGAFTGQRLPAATARWYEAALMGCESLALYAARLGREARRLAATGVDAAWAAELTRAGQVLDRVPSEPAETMQEAMQSYWLAYILVTMEMGGCAPGGGIGLGRLDQFLLPYYRRDLEAGRLTRAEALELLELFLLCFCHCDYYTEHQIYTPGSQASLGGVTPSGEDAANEMSELLMEASLRIAMPAPYLSLRLHRNMSPRFAQAAANYVLGGLGFPVVNDEAFVPAFERYGRTTDDARNYICACCYEPTIPGREAYHPSCVFVNLPMILESVLNQGRSLLKGTPIGTQPFDPSRPPSDSPRTRGENSLPACGEGRGGGVNGYAGKGVPDIRSFDDLLKALEAQIAHVLERITTLVNLADQEHCNGRRYPLMSLFIDDCVERGQDVCSGGAHYNPTGVVISGFVNCVDALAAVRQCVFEKRAFGLPALRQALAADFNGCAEIQRSLLAAPKWGDDRAQVDELGPQVTGMLLRALAGRRNARGGPYQPALYSFITNQSFGKHAGASADGRRAGTPLHRNLSPAPGSNRSGPTALLASASRLDTTGFPNGWALDLNFDPHLFAGAEARERFAGFLRGFVATGVPQIQVTMSDIATLLDAQAHPERHQELMVKVAGFSARFVDLSLEDQDQVLRKSLTAGGGRRGAGGE